MATARTKASGMSNSTFSRTWPVVLAIAVAAAILFLRQQTAFTDLVLVEQQFAVVAGRIVLSGAIVNEAAEDLRYPQFRCTQVGRGGDPISYHTVTFWETIPAGERITFSDLDIAEAAPRMNAAFCSITGASSVE